MKIKKDQQTILNWQEHFKKIIGTSGRLKISRNGEAEEDELGAQILTRAQEAALQYGLGPEPDVKEPDTELVLVEDQEGIDKVFEEVRRTGKLCIDVETTGLSAFTDEVVSYQISPRVGISYYFPFRHKGYDKNLNFPYCMGLVGDTFTDESIAKIAHNFKFDYKYWLKLGYEDIVNAHDTFIMSYLLNEGKPWGHSLKDIVLNELKYKMTKFEDLGIHTKGKFKEGMLHNFSELPLQKAIPYAGADTDYTLRLFELYLPLIEKEEFRHLYKHVEMPLVFTLARMEWKGMKIDVPYLQSLVTPFEEDILGLTKSIEEQAHAAGFRNEVDKKGFCEPFNPGSSTQVGKLVELLGLTTGKYTITGKMSVDKKSRDKLVEKHQIFMLINRLAEKQKMLGTYVLPLLNDHLNALTGRVHGEFHQTRTDTGRLSSSNPNMQNIPKSRGTIIRHAFVPDDGYRYIRADFSQIELRLVAHVSKCEPLIQAFRNGEDIHAANAIKAFNLAEKYPGITPLTLKTSKDEEIKSYRDRAKAVSFGILYGTTEYGLSKNLNCSFEEANKLINDFYEAFPELRDWINKTVRFGKSRGFVETLLRRRRRFARDENGMYRFGVERCMQNAPIQGSSADLTKLAMVQLEKRLKPFDAKLVLQVHDELITECKKEIVDEILPIVKNTMEEGFENFGIKLLVDPLVEVDVQTRWGVNCEKCENCGHWSVESVPVKKCVDCNIQV